ncbi:UNKNOWN [Stylonychia lemnae]|uniref:Uncharacterized protein n=1 Tax=Stylonychia lemnae TaxID=5949 RepID=A0A078A654_STYLE|nr:UNKNOWN [Stylonychia lemnae]|eukprot:CDW76234.1 UNKNOWN [Stylonychia lemnae]
MLSQQQNLEEEMPNKQDTTKVQQQKVFKISDNNFDFDQFYFSYAKYHYNSVNKFLHMIFIPCLVFTLFGISLHGPKMRYDICHGFYVQLDIPMVLIIVLGGTYLLVDKLTAIFTITLELIAYIWSLNLYYNDKDQFDGNHLSVMLYIHVISWIAQFIGHFIYERRAPALTDNVLLMFVAPFFFGFEVLNAFGYKKDRIQEVNKVLVQEIDQYRKGKKIM